MMFVHKSFTCAVCTSSPEALRQGPRAADDEYYCVHLLDTVVGITGTDGAELFGSLAIVEKVDPRDSSAAVCLGDGCL